MERTSWTQQPLPNGGDCTETPTGCDCKGSPIIFDLKGDGIHLSSWEDGVPFALAQPGQLWQWAWTRAGTDDAWLSLDRNGNGIIDDGSELFGDNTLQAFPPTGAVPVEQRPNGFNALAFFDLNRDRLIDARDAVFGNLRLWTDVNHDGRSQAEELTTLPEQGIVSISLNYRASGQVDSFGNEFRYRADIVAAAPVAPVVYDVFLLAAPVLADPGAQVAVDPDAPSTQDYSQWTCWAWAYAIEVVNMNDPNSGTIACDRPALVHDPIVFVNGRFARLVSRIGISIDLTTAWDIAAAQVTRAYGLTLPLCEAIEYPVPDTYLLPLYERVGNTTLPRIKCFETVVHTTPTPTPGGPRC